MAPIAAVIFDLDDTLYSERAFAHSGFDAVAQAFREILGDPAAAARRMRQLFDTGHRNRVFNTLLVEKGHSDNADRITRMVETYRTHRPTVALHPDADAALTQLRQTHKLGLITDGPAAMQRNKISALGLPPRLDAIIVTAELGEGFDKPHPRAFELIVERLGVIPQACVYVADNPRKDFLAPNNLGWRTVRVKRPDGVYAGEVAVTGGEPQRTIHTLNPLDAWL